MDTLKQDWNQLITQINSIETDIEKIESPLKIIPLAEKIRVLNQNLQLITIKTLNSLLDINNVDPLICQKCHYKMDILDGDIVCENPSCELNMY